MDTSITGSDLKGYVVPSPPTVEQQKKEIPQVKPVQENSGAGSGNLDDRALHGKDTRQRKYESYSPQEMEAAVKDIQSKFETMGRSYVFGFHKNEETGTMVAQLTDRETSEVIRQIPSEEILQLREKMKDIIGLLFDEKV